MTIRAERTDLRMEEWASRWEIAGRVGVKDAVNGEKAVKLEMRDRFGDGSFYIWEDDIYLNIDRNGISGDVDTAVYPKEVIDSIAALGLAYQQINPNPAQPGSQRYRVESQALCVPGPKGCLQPEGCPLCGRKAKTFRLTSPSSRAEDSQHNKKDRATGFFI